MLVVRTFPFQTGMKIGRKGTVQCNEETSWRWTMLKWLMHFRYRFVLQYTPISLFKANTKIAFSQVFMAPRLLQAFEQKHAFVGWWGEESNTHWIIPALECFACLGKYVSSDSLRVFFLFFFFYLLLTPLSNTLKEKKILCISVSLVYPLPWNESKPGFCRFVVHAGCICCGYS